MELEVYKLRFTQGVSEGETFEEIRKLFPAIAADELFAIEEKLEKSLTARQRWLLSSRRQPYLSSAVAVAGEEETDPITIEPADSQPNQEIIFATAEQKAQLRRLLASLPPTERLLLQLRFEQELSLDEVARLCGLGDGQRARPSLQHDLRHTQIDPHAIGNRGNHAESGGQLGCRPKPKRLSRRPYSLPNGSYGRKSYNVPPSFWSRRCVNYQTNGFGIF